MVRIFDSASAECVTNENDAQQATREVTKYHREARRVVYKLMCAELAVILPLSDDSSLCAVAV
jgi:hypothetical protein